MRQIKPLRSPIVQPFLFSFNAISTTISNLQSSLIVGAREVYNDHNRSWEETFHRQ